MQVRVLPVPVDAWGRPRARVAHGVLTQTGIRPSLAPVARVTGRGSVWRGDRRVAPLGRRSAVYRAFVVVAAGVVTAAQRDRDGCTAPDCRGNARCGSSVARELCTAQPAGRRLGRAAGRE